MLFTISLLTSDCQWQPIFLKDMMMIWMNGLPENLIILNNWTFYPLQLTVSCYNCYMIQLIVCMICGCATSQQFPQHPSMPRLHDRAQQHAPAAWRPWPGGCACHGAVSLPGSVVAVARSRSIDLFISGATVPLNECTLQLLRYGGLVGWSV